MIRTPDFTLVDVKKATASLPKQGRKMLEQYRNNMRAVNLWQSQDIDWIVKYSKNALEALSQHVVSDAKRTTVIQAVVDIVHTEIYQAMQALEGLSFYEVGEISNNVLKYAMERDTYVAKAENILKNATENDLPIMKKFQRQEYKKLMRFADAADDKRINYAKARNLALEHNRMVAEQAGKGKEYEYLYGLPD